MAKPVLSKETRFRYYTNMFAQGAGVGSLRWDEHIAPYLDFLEYHSLSKDFEKSFVLAKAVCPNFQNLFISNEKRKPNSDNTVNAWFFSGEHVVQALNLTSNEGFVLEAATLDRNVSKIAVRAHEFEFASREPNDDSWLVVDFETYADLKGHLGASGYNCLQLANIFPTLTRNLVRLGKRDR